MSDIDFDELDRAVSGALNTLPSEAEEPILEPTAQEPITQQTPVETPQIEHLERSQLNPISPIPAQPIVAPAARRSTGRFMDMVHPSSDMRSPNNIKPLETKFSAPAPRPQVVQPVEEPVIVEPPAWNEPLESPFLPDAKVEKRPLGGNTIAEEVAAPAFDFQGLLDEPDEELLEAPAPQERIEATALPDPIDFEAATTVSHEIESKVYEEDDSAKTETVQEFTEPQPSFEAKVDTPPAVELFQPVEEATPMSAPVEEATPMSAPVEEPVGPTSITPQYKEQVSTNQESGAIYDTESYHQAVVAPVKKRSGWVTLIWIVILILLGAAAGWAVYTYVLPML